MQVAIAKVTGTPRSTTAAAAESTVLDLQGKRKHPTVTTAAEKKQKPDEDRKMSAAELEDFKKMKTLVSAFYKFFVKTKNSLLDIKEIFKQVDTETYRFNNDFKNEIQSYADIESFQEQGVFQGRPGQAEQKKRQILDSVTNHTTVQANSVSEGIARV